MIIIKRERGFWVQSFVSRVTRGSNCLRCMRVPSLGQIRSIKRWWCRRFKRMVACISKDKLRKCYRSIHRAVAGLIFNFLQLPKASTALPLLQDVASFKQTWSKMEPSTASSNTQGCPLPPPFLWTTSLTCIKKKSWSDTWQTRTFSKSSTTSCQPPTQEGRSQRPAPEAVFQL